MQILSTKQLGVVVKAPDKKDRVRVAVGSIEMVVSADDLRQRVPTKIEKPKASNLKLSINRQNGPNSVKIDLHGKTVEQAIGVLEEAVNRAVLQGTKQIDIVHGLGTGRVKAAVHKYLNSLESFIAYSIHANNPGVTVARIKSR